MSNARVHLRFENGCSKNSTQKLLTKYSTEENNKHVICRPRSVRIGKNCALGVGYGPRPAALGRTQALWHSFSQYRPPGQQITYTCMYPCIQSSSAAIMWNKTGWKSKILKKENGKYKNGLSHKCHVHLSKLQSDDISGNQAAWIHLIPKWPPF